MVVVTLYQAMDTHALDGSNIKKILLSCRWLICVVRILMNYLFQQI